MLKKSPKHVWSEVDASHQGSTSAYSEMPGELDMTQKEKEQNSPVYEKGYPSYEAVNNKGNQKPLDEELREKGLL